MSLRARPSAPIRLLAVDLDGTLLDSNREIQPRSGAALERAMEAGIVVALASGRNHASLRPFAEQLGAPYPAVCANGGHVIGANGEEIRFVHLAPDAVAAALGYAREAGVHLNVYTRTDVLYPFESEWSDTYARRARTNPPQRADDSALLAAHVSKAMFVDAPDAIGRHREAFARRVGNTVELVSSEPEYLEVLPFGMDKGDGLRALAEAMGLRSEEVAAIGDWHNDLGMIRWAGWSGAMAGAVPEVRAAASVVVGSNDDGGVADFVQTLIGPDVG